MRICLHELESHQIIKCNCSNCRGTGLSTRLSEHNGVATICSECNGKGYHLKTLGYHEKLFADEETGIVYSVIDSKIMDTVNLFNGLKVRKDIKYVIYEIFEPIDQETILNNCKSDIEVIFEDCSFGLGLFTNCKDFGKEKCWEKFYRGAETPENKQKVLRKKGI